MKKIINKKTLAMCVTAAAFFVLPLSASAVDKLVVKDATSAAVFKVDDTGNVSGKGKLSIGSTNPATSTISVIDVTNAANRGIGAYQATSNNYAGVFDFRKMRGLYTETPTTENSVLNGDYVGAIHAWGVDAAGVWRRGSTLSYYIDAPPTNGGVPIAMGFFTGSNDNGLPNPKLQRLTISSTGKVKVNDLKGTYTGGSAYVCVNDSGQLFTSEDLCP